VGLPPADASNGRAGACSATETELVVERALALLDGVERPRVVDVGTGSGAIALALAHERPDAHVTATDVSAEALSLARENTEGLGLTIELVETSLLDGLAGPFDLAVSNPPYVGASELAQLEPEVRDWEPRGALLDQGRLRRSRARPGGCFRPAVGYCSRFTSGRRKPSRRCSASSATGRLGSAGTWRVASEWWRRGGKRRSPARDRCDPRGKPVLLPTDTVYGLCASAYREAPAQKLYALKGRGEDQPTALLASSVDMLFECVPELRGARGVIARTLLPGPYTLVLTKPRASLSLAERRPLEHDRRSSCRAAGRRPARPRRGRAVAATSANDPDGAAPARLDEVPERIRSACAAEIDAGPLPGVASTVIDFTGGEPVVIREGAAPAAEAIARVQEALAGTRVA